MVQPTNYDDLNKLNEQETRIQAWEIAPTLYNHPQGQQNILEWHLGQSFAQGYYTIEDQHGSKYILEQTLGEGGFGITYLAKYKEGKYLAIKTLNQKVQSHRDYHKFKDDFYNEALALARCNHPHIVRVIKIIHKQELPCIVMEYINGKNIAEIIENRGTPLSEIEAIRYIKQVAEALIEVHSKGWLHRDVKPQNIIIRQQEMTAVLIDFGIARPFLHNIDGSLTAIVTPGYAPLEQYDPDGNQGCHSDVYALAATLYYALTGIKPIDAKNRFRTEQDILPPPIKIKPNISDAVNQAILKGMEQHPQLRPQSMQEWLNLLSNTDIKPTVVKKNYSKLLGKVAVTGTAIALLSLFVHLNPFRQEQVCQNQGGVVTFCKSIADVPNVPELTQVSFAGSTTWQKLNDPKIIARIREHHPNFKLERIIPDSQEVQGSAIGINWLITGKHDLSFSQSSQRIEQWQYRDAESRGFKIQDISVADNIISIFVHPELTSQKLKGLTVDQVRKIFLGEVTNWKDVGGSDMKITVVKRKTQKTGTVDVFQDKVLNGKPYTANRIEPENATQTIRTVASTPGAIGFFSVSLVLNQERIRIVPIAKQDKSAFVSPCADDTCKAVNKNLIENSSYPKEMIGNLYVVVKLDGGLKQQAGIAYANMLLSDEGQKLIEEAGFVPLRKIP
jgi:serine/threonine protein kinase